MLPILLWIAFLESFSTGLLEFGLFFYFHERLGFGAGANLAAALAFGLAYVVGAKVSHPVAEKLNQRGALIFFILIQTVLMAILLAQPTAKLAPQLAVTLMVGLNFLVGICNAGKWPLVESFATAGRAPKQASRAVGWFNLSWSLALVPAVAVSGWVIHQWPGGLFAIAGIVGVISMGLCLRLPKDAVHLDKDHPEQLDQQTRDSWGKLLNAARWTMLSSYALLFMLNPLFPTIFSRFNIDVEEATVLASPMHAVRFLTFVFLGIITSWHGKRLGLWASMLLLPVGCVLVLFAPNVTSVVIGQIIFGWAAGYSYYASLYYAMVLKNASVEAGGAHESLIGAGFAAGPLMGLGGAALMAGIWPVQAVGLTVGFSWAYTLAAAPLILVGMIGGWKNLKPAR